MLLSANPNGLGHINETHTRAALIDIAQLGFCTFKNSYMASRISTWSRTSHAYTSRLLTCITLAPLLPSLVGSSSARLAPDVRWRDSISSRSAAFLFSCAMLDKQISLERARKTAATARWSFANVTSPVGNCSRWCCRALQESMESNFHKSPAADGTSKTSRDENAQPN